MLRSLTRLSSLAILALAAGCFLATTLVRAQSFEGALVGTILDPSGLRVAGATVSARRVESAFERATTSDSRGEFRIEALPPGEYRVTAQASGFQPAVRQVIVRVSSTPTITLRLSLAPIEERVGVQGGVQSLASQPIETTSSVQKATITAHDLAEIPLAARSFANIAYMAPMTQPVEPSDPTKARITAVAFAGSSGLNVDLSVDGGDNNDDWIGGFLQNYSPDALQEFTVRTAQFDADTSRTNGGSVILTTRRGTDVWHGSGAFFYRGQALNARNPLDNPEPNPKQPFSRDNSSFTLGGPLRKGKVYLFSSYEYVHEDASVAYSANSLTEFKALAQIAAAGLIPGVTSIGVPTSTLVPYRDNLFLVRLDWEQSPRSQWFVRGSLDRNRAINDLVQQATLPSTGATTHSNYYSVLIGQQYQFGTHWLGALTLQANGFHHTKDRNSNLGLALAFPFSASAITTSGFETFGDNQFVTSITAFPLRRDQQKYQYRYDLSFAGNGHAAKFGVNFIHEPVLGGAFAQISETLVVFPDDPSFYAANLALCVPVTNPACPFTADFAANSSFSPAGNGSFIQSVKRIGVYAQDSWRIRPSLTVNYGLRYDTTLGLFRASGRDQDQNPAFLTLKALGIPLVRGVPRDYRKAVAPRLGIAYAPAGSSSTVIRAGFGLYYNDLAQNGWVDAFRTVNTAAGVCIHPGDAGCLAPGEQGALIDPNYRTPYALQASAGFEHAFGNSWHFTVNYQHHQGVHQYRRYEYVGGVTLHSSSAPGQEPNISLFRSDNRSRYDGVSFVIQHRLSNHFELTAHYTLASASTWGATVGELFDYVNGVSNVANPFGPGDHGPSGEDVRHRLVIVGLVQLPGKFEVSTLSQFESARPYALATPVDVNGDGVANDRAVVNGVQTALDQFRGSPFVQVDLRVSRQFSFHDRVKVMPFAEFFNLFNRTNPGNNFIPDISALPTPVNSLSNATAFCLNSSCTQTAPIKSLNQLRTPAGALGDFFGLGTTVGIPFAAQIGIRVDF
jgi:hypothetical protein